ncbi:Retrovirus-related Pol polyprotein from transposon RE1 [Vitis vinifera]|uniref:Retrovirus-related Pol polyprotein from transposon RE1 n=1 Tax=Vitis vinifera TaxID=29760 RepID=A0A438GG51_VITVI|nr:Retrovirus-related Pol polyprotein from transposon RE1 [Vitis vinifera]
MHSYVVYYGNRLIPRFFFIFGPTKLVFKFWTQAKGLYTNDIQRLYKVASAIVHISQQDLDLSTYIGQIASLKEEFSTVMPLTPDVGVQQTQLDKFFMVLTLIGLRLDIEPVRDQILGSSSVPSLDDVFARLLRISSTQTLPFDSTSDSSVLVSQTSSRGGRSGTRDGLLALPMWPSPLILRCPQPPSSSASQASVASVAQPGNASACLTHTSFLGPWILDSGASDHLSGNKDLFSSITTTSALPTVTLANGSQTMAKGPEYGEDDWHRTLSKFQKMVPRFSTLSSLPCESCQLGKHTRVSFPKRLNNRAKSHFELVHTDVWGPCRTASTLGFQYFVTFIDDYSRCTCDNAREYFSAPFTSFMSHHGILHQSSCAHTPQQNGDKLSAKAMKCSSWDIPDFRRVYHRRLVSLLLSLFAEAPADSLPIPSASLAPALPSPNDLPIAVRKGWRQTMVDEMAALHSNVTWDLVVLPSGKSTVGCRWVYAVKVGPDGQVDRLKARLVAKGYTQVYGSDYGDTFSPVAKIASVRLLLSMGESGLVCRLRRSLYGLKQSPRACFSRFSSVVQEFGMLRSTEDHSVFYHHNSLGQCIYLVVYMDDIVITGSDQDGIQKLKQHLFTHFQTKDLGKLKYFLGIEIAQSSSGVVLSQRKYVLDILEETGMLDCKPVDTPMDPNVKLVPGQGEPLEDPGRYRRLSPCDSHWDAVIRILRYIKSTPGQGVLYENKGHTQVVGYTDADWAGSPTDRRSTSGYCVFIGGNLISWKSKKQDVVARSSAEAEYRAMALATCELIWLRHLLRELRFGKDEQMKLICDNQTALHIAYNPVFHERTKHIEVDCHFIREKIASGCVATSFVNSNDQLADIFTKSLRVHAVQQSLDFIFELGKIFQVFARDRSAQVDPKAAPPFPASFSPPSLVDRIFLCISPYSGFIRRSIDNHALYRMSRLATNGFSHPKIPSRWQ